MTGRGSCLPEEAGLLSCKPPNALFTVNLNFPSHGTSVTASKTA